MTAPVQVRFTEPDEYLEELERDVFRVEGKTLRLCKTASATSIGVTRIMVRAGYLLDGRPVILEHYIGDLWGQDRDVEVQDRATALVERIVGRCAELGLEQRPGILEVVVA